MRGILDYLLQRVGVMNSEVRVNKSHYRPEMPREFQEVKVPRLRVNDPSWW